MALEMTLYIFSLLQTTSTTPQPTKGINCKEVIDGKLQIQWEIQGDYLVVEMYGRIMENQYMAFGLSGVNGRAQMKGGDVVVAFYDRTKLAFRAVDYYLSHLSQCDGKNGVCPDEKIGGTNDVILLNGDRKKGVTYIKYKRPITTNDASNDLPIPIDREVSVIAAIGPLNSNKEANAHSHNGQEHTIENIQIDFSSKDEHSCPSSLYERKDDSKVKAWPTRILSGENMITARIGPTGGQRGYTAITGHPSWGIAWYLNDLLIPELYVERGQTYTFYVEGGNDETQPARLVLGNILKNLDFLINTQFQIPSILHNRLGGRWIRSKIPSKTTKTDCLRGSRIRLRRISKTNCRRKVL